MRDNQGLSEIIVSNCFSPFLPINMHTYSWADDYPSKAALLFNIHACILMGYFHNNTGDNNVFLCNIPEKKNDDTATFI